MSVVIETGGQSRMVFRDLAQKAVRGSGVAPVRQHEVDQPAGLRPLGTGISRRRRPGHRSRQPARRPSGSPDTSGPASRSPAHSAAPSGRSSYGRPRRGIANTGSANQDDFRRKPAALEHGHRASLPRASTQEPRQTGLMQQSRVRLPRFPPPDCLDLRRSIVRNLDLAPVLARGPRPGPGRG